MRSLSVLAVLFLAVPLAAQPGFGFVFAAGADGLTVQGVAADGAAAGAGIRAGDVLTKIGGREMAGETLDAAGAHLAAFTAPPRSLAFDVRRDGIGFSVLLFPTDYDRVALGESQPSAPRASPVPAGTGCVAGTCTDGTGSYRYESGATYAGAWRGGQRHGRGTYTFPSGMTFVGDWRDGRRVRGRETYANGNAYDGEYADDTRHGRGTMTFASGKVYTGDWAEGMFNGTGRYTWPSGAVYEGQWVADKRHGQGTMRHADGRVESGTWREGTFAGSAPAPVATAPVLLPGPPGMGCVDGNCVDGDGTFRYDSGAMYAGAWQGGKRHGYGIFTFTNGMTLIAEWADGTQVRGRETYASGAVYTGQYVNGQRHGEGEMVFANGEVYVGGWADGVQHGVGRYTWPNGAVYEGDFADGVRHGQGTMRHADGTVNSGEWHDGASVGPRRTPRVTNVLGDGRP